MENKKNILANLSALVASLGIAAITPDAGLAALMGGLATNIGSQYIYDTLNPPWQKLFKGKDGILNHDIQKALVAAIQQACKQINEAYIQTHQPDAPEKKAIEKFLTDLGIEAEKHLLSETAATDPVKAEELLQYLSFNNTQETYPQLAERLKLNTPIPNQWENDKLSEQFLQFFTDQLAPLVKEEFINAITDNPIAKSKIELLYFECLQQSVTQGHAQILDTLQTIQSQTATTDTYSQLWVNAIHKFNDRFDELKKGQDSILSEINKLPANMQKAVTNALQQLPPSALTPDFNVSVRFELLSNRLRELQTNFDNTTQKANKTKKGIAVSPEEVKKILEERLQELEVERLQISKKKGDTEKELQDFIADVLKLAATLDASTGTQSPRLQQARQLFAKGKFEEANAALNEAAIFDARKNLREQLENLAEELLLKAQLTALNKTLPNWFEEAKRFYEEAVNTHQNYHTYYEYAHFLDYHNQHEKAVKYYNQALPCAKDDTDKANTLNNLGNLYKAKNQFLEAELVYTQALQIRKELALQYPQSYLPSVAATLNNLGNLHRDKSQFFKAEEEYTEALEIYRSFAFENPQHYLTYVAITLHNLGVLHRARNEFLEAEVVYTEALEIRKSLATENPQRYLSDVADTLNNLGLLHSDRNEFDKAETKYTKALAIRRSLAADNPYSYLPALAMTLNNLGALNYDKNEFDKAEAEYTEALEIYRSLAADNAQSYLPDVAMTLNNLGILHRAKNEFEKAEVEHIEALTIRKSLAVDNPKIYLSDVADTLNDLGILHRAKNEFLETEAKYKEALAIRKSLATENPQSYLPDVAATAMNLSIFYLKYVSNQDKSLAYAKEALKAAWPFVDMLPRVKQYASTIMQIVEYWDLDPDAFKQACIVELEDEGKI